MSTDTQTRFGVVDADETAAALEARRMLADTAARYVERSYGFAARTKALGEPDGFSRARWAEFAGMGWLGIGLPEECGGFGGAPEQAVLAEALGRALAVEPWLANAALAGPLLAASSSDAQRAHAAAMVEGRKMLALAAFERQGRHDAFDVATVARRDGAGWRLDGAKTLVLGGGGADLLLVLARTSGTQRDPHGLSLFAVPADASGLRVAALPTYDGRQTADVTIADVVAPADTLVGEVDTAWPAVEAALDRATVMLCAECVGAMSLAWETTREYLKTRRQFGRAITDNQVIRHRLVDLHVATEQARAITESAADRLADEPAARRRAVSLAKAFVSSAGRRVGEDAVQLHGAIGMTDEYVVGQCYKRLAAAANLFGDEGWHLERLGDGSPPPAGSRAC